MNTEAQVVDIGGTWISVQGAVVESLAAVGASRRRLRNSAASLATVMADIRADVARLQRSRDLLRRTVPRPWRLPDRDPAKPAAKVT